MIADIAAWLFATFVVDPLQAEMKQQLDRGNVSMEAVQQSHQCLATQVPRLIDRAGNELGWAIATAVGISTGWTSPDNLFESNDPKCAALRALIKSDNNREAEG
ncbi:hypothetical protein [Rhizobium sp. RM]|uniref:hypothetical protein n=1 Tax=Rhizobium sp. RM TaxID=2748079 RepID=UPI00110D965D|nr:hypothetical protein [Rhizobium sp. RM]NWJ23081.1 hypothetical protein [Rhizobium sp. RM]TMV22008.1 hypothetical protein BJG94_03840 [Rhizobium sp. Td3]